MMERICRSPSSPNEAVEKASSDLHPAVNQIEYQAEVPLAQSCPTLMLTAFLEAVAETLRSRQNIQLTQ
jgi:hypothetical protein